MSAANSDLPARLGELIEPEARRAGIESGVLVGRVWQSWGRIVGPDVAQHAEPTSLRAGVLRIRADSPAWSTELSYLVDELRTLINDAVGHRLVREVQVWSGPGRISERFKTVKSEPAQRPMPDSGGDPHKALQRARHAWLRRQEGAR
jgi:predicted nucleic acid-binding Zn ribbon protein